MYLSSQARKPLAAASLDDIVKQKQASNYNVNYCTN